MCSGHKFVKSSLFQSPGYLIDLSPYISAVITSRFLATPIQLTTNVLKPIAKTLLPTRASNFILNGTLTCEHCLHQVYQDSFDDGRQCPKLLLDKFSLPETEFILADELIEAQEKILVHNQNRLLDQTKPTNTDSPSPDAESTVSGGQQLNPSECFNESKKYKDHLLIMQICPEIGLHAQMYKCVDCDSDIDLSSARLCNYDGRYYCNNCHTNSYSSPIPARILRNWDFTPKSVSKSSWHKICFLRTRPVLFNLFQINSMLYGFIERLAEIKQRRGEINLMLNYVQVCGQPEKPCLTSVPKHFLNDQLINFLTLNDLYDTNQVYQTLTEVQSTLKSHITKFCESCRGKGYYCELCKDPREILYPFSKNTMSCSNCRAVYHKTCFQRKKKNCPRCIRLEKKRISVTSES